MFFKLGNNSLFIKFNNSSPVNAFPSLLSTAQFFHLYFSGTIDL